MQVSGFLTKRIFSHARLTFRDTNDVLGQRQVLKSAVLLMFFYCALSLLCVSTWSSVIVDNNDGPPAYVESGSWFSSTLPGYNGLTYRAAWAGDPSSATWTANLPAFGVYEVWAIFTEHPNRVGSAKYTVDAADGAHTVYLNQAGPIAELLVERLVGTFTFHAGDSSILLDAQASSPTGNAVIADAIRFDPIGTPTPTRTPVNTPLPTPHHWAREWNQYRGDTAMTGRASAPGLIKSAPTNGWTFDIAAWEGYLSIDRQYSSNQVSLPYHSTVNPGYYSANEYDWGLGAPRYDLYGTGSLVTVPEWKLYTYKVDKILPSVTGLQKFVYEDMFDGYDPAVGRLYAYDTGSERLVWTTSAYSTMYSPCVLSVDADNDGQLDLVVTAWGRILVFDGATGATKMHLPYQVVRHYGWFGSANIDGDPYPEFCVIGEFSSHFEVIDNNGSSLSVLWQKNIEVSISAKQKETRPQPDAFMDIDNDGDVEVFMNIYDATGDQKWHFLVYDAVTGATKYDYAEKYFVGLDDLDSDGLSEVFLMDTSGRAKPTYSTLRLWNLRPGLSPLERWTHSYGRWNTRQQYNFPLTVATLADEGQKIVVLEDINEDGRTDFFVSAPGSSDEETCTAYGLNGSGIVESIWSVEAPPGARMSCLAGADIDTDTYNEALIHIKGRGHEGESVTCSSAGGTLRQWSRASMQPGTPVVADLNEDGNMEVVVVTGTDEVACIQAPRYSDSDQTPVETWRVRGRGMTMSAGSGHEGVSAADLDGDGSKEVLICQEASNGQASLHVLNFDGTTAWQKNFARIDGSPPYWNLGGMTYWVPGNFTSTSHKDVYVSLRRSTMHSDIGYLLDGRNGDTVWTRDGIPLAAHVTRGHGGYPSAAADVDEDYLDELIGEYPDRFYVIDGPSGDPDVVKNTQSGVLGFNFWAYAHPAVIELFGDSDPEIIWGACQYGTAMFTPDGTVVWQGTYGDGTYSLQAVGDIDGDGDLEMCGVYGTTFRVYDPSTGTVVDSLSGVPAPVHVVYPIAVALVSADIDDDGRDEFLWGTSNSIVCIEQEGSTLQTAWTKSIGSSCSDLALADVNYDCYLEIVVCTADGYVRVFNGEEALSHPCDMTGTRNWEQYR